jgi:hypothetical protein
MRYGHAIVGVGLLVATLVGTVSAGERSVPRTETAAEITERCVNDGEFAEAVANLRDKGVSVGAALEFVRARTRQPRAGLTQADLGRLEARLTTMVRLI